MEKTTLQLSRAGRDYYLHLGTGAETKYFREGHSELFPVRPTFFQSALRAAMAGEAEGFRVAVHSDVEVLLDVMDEIFKDPERIKPTEIGSLEGMDDQSE